MGAHLRSAVQKPDSGSMQSTPCRSIRRWVDAAAVAAKSTGCTAVIRYWRATVAGAHTLLRRRSIETSGWCFRFILDVDTFRDVPLGYGWRVVTPAVWTRNIVGIQRGRWWRQISQTTSWSREDRSAMQSRPFTTTNLLSRIAWLV